MAATKPIIIKFGPGWPPPMGFRVDDYYGFRSGSRAATYWVDADIGLDANPGTDPEYPKLTIQGAVNSLRAADCGAQIYCRGVFGENVIVPPTAPTNVALYGAGDNWIAAPIWAPLTAPGTCLTLRQSGWTVEGFCFTIGANGIGIVLEWEPLPAPGRGYVGNRAIIRGNHFDGAWGGLYGINFHGAPFDVHIIGNEFREFRRGDNSATAIITTDTLEAHPYMAVIRDNLFWENENHIRGLGNIRNFNNSIFTGNIFNQGVLITAQSMLDLRGGGQGENIVTRNVFCGDYSNVGGYWDNAAGAGMWVGNFAEDLLEAEVGDNGLTIGPPV